MFDFVIKTLDVTLDANLTLNQHVSSLCKSMHFHNRALCHIYALIQSAAAQFSNCNN